MQKFKGGPGNKSNIDVVEEAFYVMIREIMVTIQFDKVIAVGFVHLNRLL